MKVYGVTGWKNAGKTGLMERLVAEITGRGFTVSTVKHAHHTFDVDHPGKDSHMFKPVNGLVRFTPSSWANQFKYASGVFCGSVRTDRDSLFVSESVGLV